MAPGQEQLHYDGDQEDKELIHVIYSKSRSTNLMT